MTVTISTSNRSTATGELLDGREIDIPLLDTSNKFIVDTGDELAVVWPDSVEAMVFHGEGGDDLPSHHAVGEPQNSFQG